MYGCMPKFVYFTLHSLSFSSTSNPHDWRLSRDQFARVASTIEARASNQHEARHSPLLGKCSVQKSPTPVSISGDPFMSGRSTENVKQLFDRARRTTRALLPTNIYPRLVPILADAALGDGAVSYRVWLSFRGCIPTKRSNSDHCDRIPPCRRTMTSASYVLCMGLRSESEKALPSSQLSLIEGGGY